VKPYYQDDYATIYHGDCRDILPGLEPVDLVLTDPPYGLNWDYASHDDTPEALQELIDAVVPVCIENATRVMLTCGQTNIHKYPLPDWNLAWVFKAGVGQNPWGFTGWQPILVWGKDAYRAAGMGARPDYIEKTCGAMVDWDHPCPKPLPVWELVLLRGSVSESDVVLDPFMGSGTTLVAAKNLGRKSIGIEIEEKYCEIAAQRLSQEVLAL